MKKQIIFIGIIMGIISIFGIIFLLPSLIGGFSNLNINCGNGICEDYENAWICSKDCGEVATTCGDGECSNGEDKINCPGDCGKIISCGDATCDSGESEDTCPQDCGLKKPSCGDDKCEITSSENEFYTCTQDCEVICGDNLCMINNEEDTCPQDCGNTPIWLQEYEFMRKSAGISDKYLEKEWDYDYDNPAIQSLINQAKQSTFNSKDASKQITKSIFDKIDYNAELSSGRDCTKVKASEVLERGWGWCSTMSKVNIATLRGLGIASRPVNGCLTFKEFCVKFKIISEEDLPKTEPVSLEDGKYVVGGGLHGWVEIWLPDEGWVLLESTSGKVFKVNCVNYQRFKESVKTNREDFCYISDNVFGQFCANF